jgi:hypothetical protein
MSDRPGLFAAPRHTVLSLSVEPESAIPERDRSQFEVLVRHLIYRFFHNELLASDDETRRVMLVSYTAALPSFVLTLFLYFIYHFALPPMPYPRPFWSQIGDHYFFVMYSFLIMGAAAVYEWDLLFPDLLDVFVLSVLPISTRRLFFARVLALTIFLGAVLIGTSILGTLFFPVVADLPRFGYHLLAHALSVLMSGTFAAASFLALQGILLNTVGQRVFRRITPFLQGGSMMLLLAVLLFYPAVCHSIMPLLTSDSTAVRCFPPFWFLGVYERILQGPSALPIFSQLAHTACNALMLMLLIVLLTYPLAYRRRVRQLIEGAGVIDNPSRTAAPLRHVLHTVILRRPAQRAVFHFVSQTILRAQRQRVMLGLYGGLALALTISNMVVLRIAAGHLRPSLLSYGIRTAVPIMAFWTIVALSSIVSAPIDRRCSWLFHAIIGRPGPDHLAGTRTWITLWAMLISLTTALVLHALSPAQLRTPLVTAGQALVAIGISLLLTDLCLYSVRTIPFTHLRTSSITDFPLMVVRYFVFFPFFVFIVVHQERWIEASVAHLLKTFLFLAIAHTVLMKAHQHALRQSMLETAPEESDEFLQRLGLCDH